MAKVPNGLLPKISIAWVGCTNVTDRRQTDRRAMTYSEFAKTSRENYFPSRGVAYRLSFTLPLCFDAWLPVYIFCVRTVFPIFHYSSCAILCGHLSNS